VRIGVISDTHNFLDPRVSGLFKGVEHILHAGDIGLPAILQELRQIAPVTAVGGNTDDPGLRYPETVTLQLGGLTFLVVHIVDPRRMADLLRAKPEKNRPDVVVFGHTHKPFCERRDNTLFFNPGYAGRARFNLPRSIAIIECRGGELRSEHLPL
jgi:putative phosphoesterase